MIELNNPVNLTDITVKPIGNSYETPGLYDSGRNVGITTSAINVTPGNLPETNTVFPTKYTYPVNSGLTQNKTTVSTTPYFKGKSVNPVYTDETYDLGPQPVQTTMKLNTVPKFK